MADLIYRQELLEWFKNWSDYDEFSVSYITGIIEDAPSVDAVEVVRCADCKHSYESVAGWICSHGVCVDCVVRDDFYCAYGERK